MHWQWCIGKEAVQYWGYCTLSGHNFYVKIRFLWSETKNWGAPAPLAPWFLHLRLVKLKCCTEYCTTGISIQTCMGDRSHRGLNSYYIPRNYNKSGPMAPWWNAYERDHCSQLDIRLLIFHGYGASF